LSGFSFTLQATPLKKKRSLNEEEREEIHSAITELLSEFFEEHLTNEADAALWEDIDACAGTLAELDCDELKKARVTFVFHDSWRGGAEAAEHWYRLAIHHKKEALNEILAEVGLQIKAPEFDALLREANNKPLAEVSGQLYALEDDGAPILAEGEELTLSLEEKRRLQKIAISKQCQCQLCAKESG
jgi:hypothetical protein